MTIFVHLSVLVNYDNLCSSRAKFSRVMLSGQWVSSQNARESAGRKHEVDG
jgi:hypothetical protein